MSALVYTPPEQLKVPELRLKTGDNAGEVLSAYDKACDEFVFSLRRFCLNQKRGKYIGEVIRLAVGDGYAQYMIMSLRPLQLIWIPTGDAWRFGYDHLLTEKEVRENVERQKKLANLSAVR
jgi:hypothetical protein